MAPGPLDTRLQCSPEEKRVVYSSQVGERAVGLWLGPVPVVARWRRQPEIYQILCLLDGKPSTDIGIWGIMMRRFGIAVLNFRRGRWYAVTPNYNHTICTHV